MHEAVEFLRKKAEASKKELEELAKALAKQAEREQKQLESIEFGNDFDADSALPQERIVEALQEALEGAEEARAGLIRVVTALKGVR